MRRHSTLLLNVLVILGLTFSGLLAALPAAVTHQAQAAPTANGDLSTASDLAGKRAKHKHNKQKKERKKDRKQKDRKQKHDRKQKNRKKSHKHDGGQARELTTGVLPGADTVDPIGPGGQLSVKDHYIVLLKSGTDDALATTNAVSRDVGGVTPTHVYRYVFDGFAAVIPPDKLDAVRNDPRVEAVVPDGVVEAFAQTLPTGVDRIAANENPTADIDGNDERVDVDVAVIDTAGKGTHEDLNQHAWGNCTTSHENGDDNGHGTHVSGTIGALDNGVGVVGVAPGARLWNIRVLVGLPNGNATGRNSWVICGLDLVTQYATPQSDGLGDIEVANMSLGGDAPDPNDVCGSGSFEPLHEAICEAVAAGVPVAVAAGNDHINAQFVAPATFEEVITVSALADSNGQGGAPGPNTSAGPDESLATFSNFGDDVDIAAPGVDILSTVPTKPCPGCDPTGYRADYSGTSMASPHVAGAAALYLATHPGATPTEVRSAIDAAKEPGPIAGDDSDTDDEGILNAGASFGAAVATRNSAQSVSDETRHAKDKKEAKKKDGKQKRQGQEHGKAKSKKRG